MATQTFAVTGMTCEHCVNAVSSELKAIAGVTDVVVDLAPEAASTVTITSETPVPTDRIAAALDEAGDYQLA